MTNVNPTVKILLSAPFQSLAPKKPITPNKKTTRQK